jgi:hypothetical protein
VASYETLERAWKGLRRSHGVRIREIACEGVARTLLLAEAGAPLAPAVHLCAGVHGDEPAAPWALLSLVRDGLLDRRFAYRIWPCTNPSGYRLGTRANAEGADVNRSFGKGGTTPEARAIVTALRDRRFELSIDLHEDFEAGGFYLFEPGSAGIASSGGEASGLGPAVISALDDAGIPIHRLESGFDVGYPPGSGHRCRFERGRVLPDIDEELQLFRGGLPLSIFLARRLARKVLTFESPRGLPWEDRIAAHRVAVVAAIEAFRQATRNLPA